MVTKISQEEEILWQKFCERQKLSSLQIEQFKNYYDLLRLANELHNLTAITDLGSVIADHFEDSLALRSFIDCHSLRTLADIGTGAGFPALPLKILFPHLSLVLIEVNHKKIDFLKRVTEELHLENVTLCDLDLRTFIRKTDYAIDLFCARASLQVEELLRIFKPSSPYKHARLVYWASDRWKADPSILHHIEREEWYSIGNKKRRLIFFRDSHEPS
jgi:16S rRNA (guanine527-N7)-methyltransferase